MNRDGIKAELEETSLAELSKINPAIAKGRRTRDVRTPCR